MYNVKMPWFRDAKYGLFIHMGLYSILGGEYKGRKTDRISEWIMNYLDIPKKEYRRLASEFDPVEFDANEIVRRAKYDWGMKYVVFVSKHHEGFALFKSETSPYNSVDASPCHRDFVRELSEACRKYDMKFGLYYSQAQDWDDPNGYMKFRDNSHKDFQRYLDEKCKPQLRELLTQYGKIDLIWFDTPMGTSREQSQELIDLVKSLQPDCIISGRIGNQLGDYMSTGDNYILRLPFKGDWEAPATLNNTWGYDKFDNNWKKPEEILAQLLKVNERGGNYLINIGPDEKGRIPEKSVEILNYIGDYLKENGDAVYKTHSLPIYPYDLFGVKLTLKDYKLFVHVLRPMNRIEIINISNSVKKAYIVRNQQDLDFRVNTVCEGEGRIEVDLPANMHKEKDFSVCIEMGEKDPIFQEIR